MADMCMLREFQILQDGSACHDTAFEMVYAEALEAFHLKMLVKFLAGGLFVEHPFVEFEGDMLRKEKAFEVSLLASFI